MGPDGKPWDPARRAQRVAERQPQAGGPGGSDQAAMNSQQGGNVEGQPSGESAEAAKE
jgi:hypothetical protein